MDSTFPSCSRSVWQANLPCITLNLAGEWQKSANSSLTSHQQTPKKLTTEAIFVLSVIFLFVLLAVIGSSVNAFENLYKAFFRKKTHLGDQNGRNVETQDDNKSTSNGSTDWMRKCRKYLDCFCIQDNARKILASAPTEGNMGFIDGIRAIFFIFVYGGHFFMYYGAAMKNIEKHMHAILETETIKLSTYAAFSVDAFILLSGFLSGYFFTDFYVRNNGKVPWIAFYSSRILRITPLYMVILGIYATLLPYMSSSPVWPTYNTNPVCKKTWIMNLLYVNNLTSMYNQCLGMSWFLACIMQLFVVSPLFMILLIRSPLAGYVLSGITIIYSCFSRFQLTKQYNLLGGVPRPPARYDTLIKRLFQYNDKLHQKAYLRTAPFIIGMLLGCYLYRKKLTKKNHWITLFFGWISSVLLILVSFYALYNREEDVLNSAVYNAFKDLLFSCGFAWMIFVCVTGQGGFFQKFLSYKIHKPISRLSFAGCLTQAIVFEVYFLSVDVHADESIIYKGLFSNLSWFLLYLHLLIWTLVSAFVVSLLFESPVIRLLNILFPSKKKMPKKKL